MTESLGWLATALFTASYFFRQQRRLLFLQLLASLLWLSYGVAIGARPVIVANVLVACAAGVGLWRTFRPAQQEVAPASAGTSPPRAPLGPVGRGRTTC